MRQSLTTKQIMNEWKSFQRKDLRTTILEQRRKGDENIIRQTGMICDEFARISYITIVNLVEEAIPVGTKEEFPVIGDVDIGRLVNATLNGANWVETSKYLAAKKFMKLRFDTEDMEEMGQQIRAEISNSLVSDLSSNPVLRSTIDTLNLIGDGEELGTRFVTKFSEGIAKINARWFAAVAWTLIFREGDYMKKLVTMVKDIERRTIQEVFESDKSLSRDLVSYVLSNTVFKYNLNDLVTKLGLEGQEAMALKGAAIVLGVPKSGPIFSGKDACINAAAESIGKRLESKLGNTGKGGGICGALIAIENIKEAMANKEIGSLFETFPKLMSCLSENNEFFKQLKDVLAPAIMNDAEAGEVRNLLSKMGVPKGKADKFIEFAITKNILKTGEAVT